MSRSLGENISYYRKLKGYSQKQLADMMDISTSFMSQIENGISNPSYENIEKFAKFLDIDKNELIAKDIKGDYIDPVNELIDLLIKLTENEKIKWTEDDEYFNTQVDDNYYSFDQYKKELTVSYDNISSTIATRTLYNDKLTTLSNTIKIFNNDQTHIYKAINDLKDLLEED